MNGVFPGHQFAPRRGANGWYVVIGQDDAGRRQGVQIRRRNFASVKADVAPAQVVGYDENHVLHVTPIDAQREREMEQIEKQQKTARGYHDRWRWRVGRVRDRLSYYYFAFAFDFLYEQL